MTLDEVIAALRRGHCTEAKAREAGCGLCVPRYEAIAQVQAWHADLDALRDAPPTARLTRERDEAIAKRDATAAVLMRQAERAEAAEARVRELAAERDEALASAEMWSDNARASTIDLSRAMARAEKTEVALAETRAQLARLREAAEPIAGLRFAADPATPRPLFQSQVQPLRAALSALRETEAHARDLAAELAAIDSRPRNPPPTTFLALDGTETPIGEALRRAAEEPRGTAGDRCDGGNACGRLGCPECQQ